jgi:carbon storage regulator CsrA
MEGSTMLVLSRRRNGKIFIGDNIEVVVVEVRHNGVVRLGIDAPADVHILRDDCENKEPRDHGHATPQPTITPGP